MRRLSVVLLLTFLSLPAFAASDVVSWRQVASESDMFFTQGTNTAVPVPSFRGDLTFEPDSPATSRITLYADLSAAFATQDSLNAPDIRQNLAMAQSLGNVRATGPGTAIITSTGFRKEGDKRFVMQATVAMNGRTKAIEIPITAAVVSYFDLPKLVIEGSFPFAPRDYATEGLTVPPGVDTVKVDFKIAGIPEDAR
jgi:polyisoprenoid-binding protein YceI